jgi:hypothetical protein
MGLTFQGSRPLPGGSVEIGYAVSSSRGVAAAREAGWKPASQRAR